MQFVWTNTFQVIQIVFVVIFNSSLNIVTVQRRFRVVLEFYRQANTLVEYVCFSYNCIIQARLNLFYYFLVSQ